ncbi:hypothetical protein RRG08_025689 [Elysia crispata]|uniref:Uncharacterized protein n=1 Tax=Elysia crispata TaxID=231223 RepID=A0AAE1AX26_9GAST|nr:hypothetical protein RRG08_025689 [Elysia crispata]
MLGANQSLLASQWFSKRFHSRKSECFLTEVNNASDNDIIQNVRSRSNALHFENSCPNNELFFVMSVWGDKSNLLLPSCRLRRVNALRWP